MKKLLIILIALLLISSTLLFARANDKLAIGGQLGFLASGAVVDVPLGPLAVQAGINYPLGIKYIGEVTGAGDELDAILNAFFLVSADVTYPISLGDNFDIKIGASALGITDFAEGFVGVAGVAIKGEFWIQEKNIGLFANFNAPMIVFSLPGGIIADVLQAPLLPLVGLVTSTAGVLWRL